MKICVNCKIEKDKLDFNKNKSKPDGLSNICRDCSKIKSKTYYLENTENHKQITSERKSVVRKKLKLYVDDLKTKSGCTKCDETDICCLEFHHLNSEDKEANISDLMKMPSERKLLDELKKCVIVCANCHRKIHNNAGIL